MAALRQRSADHKGAHKALTGFRMLTSILEDAEDETGCGAVARPARTWRETRHNNDSLKGKRAGGGTRREGIVEACHPIGRREPVIGLY